MTDVERVTLQELHGRSGTTKAIADLSGVSEGEVLGQLRDLNDRLRYILGYEDDAITASSNGSWRADGVAGVLRLNSSVELEVVPKFLDKSNWHWRADFLLLAVLVRTGHLLLHDQISASTQERGDLATIIAQSFLKICAENERRPIRAYRRNRRAEFALDGDVDWETVLLPDADGFAVNRLELSRRNSFNSTLRQAVQILISEVADADTQAQLRLLSRAIGVQGKVPATYAPLPSRSRSWEQPYELAQLIVGGLGLNSDQGASSGPGFVVSTWAAWESLCEEVIRRALPDHEVRAQKKWVLGSRGSDLVYVKPDISPVVDGSSEYLLDAKYKTRAGRSPSISSSDLYESLAFLRASGAKRIVLLYPARESLTVQAQGSWRKFDEVEVDDLLVEGVEVQVQGLAARGGFDVLVCNARKELWSRSNG